MKAIQLTVLIFLIMPSFSWAQTNVLDFDTLLRPGTSWEPIGDTYTEDGFIFSAVGGFQRLAVPQTNSSIYRGSPALFHENAEGWIMLSRTNAGRFDLLQMTLYSLSYGLPSSVRFYGYRGHSLVVTQDVITRGGDIQTFTFSGFTNLNEIRCQENLPCYQIDNVVVQPYPQSDPLPELDISWFGDYYDIGISYVHVGKQFVLQRSNDLIHWRSTQTNTAYSTFLFGPVCLIGEVPRQEFFRILRLD